MSQRRTGGMSGGRLGNVPAEPNDLDDVKAMAARTRSRTGSVSIPAQLPSAAPRADGSRGGEMPSWLWGVVGCLSVLVVGFAGLWWAASSGVALFDHVPGRARPGGGLFGSGAIAADGSQRHPSRIQVEPLAARAAAEPMPPLATVRTEPKRPPARERAASAPPAAPAPARAAKSPVARAAGDDPRQAATEEADDGDREKGKDRKAEAAPAARETETAAREAAPAAEAAPREAAVLREISGPADDDRAREAAPAEVVEAALTALAPKVKRCFFKYQIPGKAQVKLVAAPAGGAAESVSVSGEFEGTPTGECVANEVASSSLPAFKAGAPVRVSHTYVLR